MRSAKFTGIKKRDNLFLSRNSRLSHCLYSRIATRSPLCINIVCPYRHIYTYTHTDIHCCNALTILVWICEIQSCQEQSAINAVSNSICHRAALHAFLLFNVSERDDMLYCFFICCLVILCLSCTCPVLVRFPRGDYILVNNSSVVNSILAKANHFLPRSLRLAPIW